MDKPKGYETWLTPLEAAKLANCTDTNIMYYIRNGKLTAKKFGNRWLIERESLSRVFPDAVL